MILYRIPKGTNAKRSKEPFEGGWEDVITTKEVIYSEAETTKTALWHIFALPSEARPWVRFAVLNVLVHGIERD